jgi:hypothetical protein
MTPVMRPKKRLLFIGASLLLLVSPLISCSSTPPSKKPTETEMRQKLRQAGPVPGDVRLVNGIEYVYAHNNKYGISPDEPEYIWINKQYYTPGANEPPMSDAAWDKERKALLERLEKLEAEVKQNSR